MYHSLRIVPLLLLLALCISGCDLLIQLRDDYSNGPITEPRDEKIFTSTVHLGESHDDRLIKPVAESLFTWWKGELRFSILAIGLQPGARYQQYVLNTDRCPQNWNEAFRHILFPLDSQIALGSNATGRFPVADRHGRYTYYREIRYDDLTHNLRGYNRLGPSEPLDLDRRALFIYSEDNGSWGCAALE